MLNNATINTVQSYSKGNLESFSQMIFKMHTLFFLVFFTLLLSGCGGGDSEQNTQEPDAVVQDLPILYIKRSLPVDENGLPITINLTEPAAFNPGAELILRELASPSSNELSLHEALFEAAGFTEDEEIDIKDLAVSSDGRKLLFSLRAPEIENADEDEQPTWNIWLYDLDDDSLRRVITSDLTAEQGQDIGGAFLPDGRIVFSSTRQQSNKSTLLDEGKPQYSGLEEDRDVEAFVLHIMDEEGTNIRQITFNQSHDLDPSVLLDGRIVFTRWDNVGGRSNFNLYTVSPDGRKLEILYGNHSHDTGTNGNRIEFLSPRELPDGRLLTMTRARSTTKLGADLTSIDILNNTDNNIAVITGTTSTDAQISLTADDVSNDETEISAGGYFTSAYPLWDGTDRILVSWSLCRLTEVVNGVDEIVACTEERLADPAAIEAAPKYGIWMMDQIDDTILPIDIGSEDFMFSEVVAMQPRATPQFIPDGIIGTDLEQDLFDENVGVVHIRSVYDFDGIDVTTASIATVADPMLTTAAERPARFLRLVKAVSMPDDDLVDLDNTAFGRSANQLMREILGYVPIEPDGSVKFKVPANVAFSISILDSRGRRIGGRHQNWLQVKPGESVECRGCHTANSDFPHGRLDAQPDSAHLGATVTGAPYPNTEPQLFADAGESMAEIWSRINGHRTPIVDISFTDDWTDPAVRDKDLGFDWQYIDLQTPAPASPNCITNWTAICRVVINYEDHIQPIWERPRITLDVDGITVLSDNTCTACHSPSDDMGLARVPAMQLDLSSSTSTDEPDHLTSYRELLFGDNQQEVANGALIDLLVPLLDGNGDPVYELDIDGNLILDALGNPIPVMVTVGINAPLSANGALSSNRLFSLFTAGGSHAGYLDDVELKLIAEWLDIGAQYYNNPFAVPQN